MLLFLATEVYSCKFGTFLYNTERERSLYHLKEKTVSIWTYINNNKQRFLNLAYQEEKQDSLENIPITNYHELKVWQELFLKYTDLNNIIKTTYYDPPE